MKSNNKLREIVINIRACYFFDDAVNINNIASKTQRKCHTKMILFTYVTPLDM